MRSTNRREFLGQIGGGMLASALGWSLASELGFTGTLLAADDGPLDFGPLERLASLLQETPAETILAKMKSELDRGTDLRSLVAAAALANARTFGGQDYTGYHCFMSLVPAYDMTKRLTGTRAALPVLKVLHRNARRTQEKGGRRAEVLRRVAKPEQSVSDPEARLLAAARSGDYAGAEASLARIAASGLEPAYRALQPLVRDNIDVHQVVLAYRCWDMMQLTGRPNGETLLRQAMRHCVERDEGRRTQGRPVPTIRELLPRLIDRHRLDREIRTTRRLDTSALESLARDFFGGDRDGAAEQTAALLAEGVSREDIGEALSLASVRLLLHDPGSNRAQEGKPAGSVHGASIGVHAADSANAWRGIAAEVDPLNAHASLVTAAWHTAGQSAGMDGTLPHHAGARDAAATIPPEQLLDAIDEAIRGRDQNAAAALTERYGMLGRDVQPLLARLLEPAIRDDGALHHEKYFLTATQEFSRTREALRFEHLVSLARVMASGYGFEAPGVAEAERLLGV